MPRREEDPAERELVITRVFDAPARLLFQAYSTREHLMKWFGPKGWPLTLCELDFRVGGRYRFAMTGPSGEQNTPFGGEYREIVTDRKIVFDNAFEAPGAEKDDRHRHVRRSQGRDHAHDPHAVRIGGDEERIRRPRVRAGHELGPRSARGGRGRQPPSRRGAHVLHARPQDFELSYFRTYASGVIQTRYRRTR